jgi:hypothetical protein
MAITWRSLAGAPLPDVSRQMELGQRGIMGGFDALNNVLKQREAFEAEQAKDVRETNKQNVLDMLQGARTPEELEALKQSPELANAMARLTTENRAAVRGQDEARMATVRKNILEAQTFDNQQVLQKEQPIIDKASAYYLSGDFEKGDAIAAANPDLRNVLAIAKARAQGELHGSTLLTQEAQQIGALAQAENAGVSRAGAMAEAQRKAREGQLKAIVQNSTYGGGSMDNVDGMKVWREEVQKRVPSTAQQEDIFYNFSKYYPDGKIQVGVDDKGQPIKLPIPVSVAIKMIDSASDSMHFSPIGSRRGDDAVNRLDRLLKHADTQDTELIKEMAGVYEAMNNFKFAPALTGETQNPRSTVQDLRDTLREMSSQRGKKKAN